MFELLFLLLINLIIIDGGERLFFFILYDFLLCIVFFFGNRLIYSYNIINKMIIFLIRKWALLCISTFA